MVEAIKGLKLNISQYLAFQQFRTLKELSSGMRVCLDQYVYEDNKQIICNIKLKRYPPGYQQCLSCAKKINRFSSLEI